MNGVRFAAVAPSGWAALAPFVLDANRRPDGRVRCLHFDHGDDVAALAAELQSLPEGEALFIAAHGPAGTAGVIGAEFDTALGRAWLRGPLLAPGVADGQALARALIAALRDALPPAVVRLDAFPQADEALLCATYAAEGFEDRGVNHVLQVPAPAVPPAWPATVADSLDDEAAATQAAQVHATLFPEGYLTPATLLSTRDEDHRLLVAAGGAGYLYVQHDRTLGEAYVDYVGVAPSLQGRGIGRALLDAALHWAFVQRGLPRLALTVRADRAPALALYRAAGFTEVSAGRHLCGSRPAGR